MTSPATPPTAKRGPGRPRLGDPIEVRLDLDAVDSVLGDGETRQDMVRAAVAAEVTRRRAELDN